MMESPLPAWEQCKALLAERLPAEDAAAWLAPLRLVSLDPRRVVLGGLPNAFFRSRVEKQLRALVLECLRTAFPELNGAARPRLECRIAESAAPGPAAPPDDPAQLPLPLAGADAAAAGPADGEIVLPRPARLTFASVVEGESNRLALQFARDVAAQPGARFNPLYLCGPTGSGKTHLLQALVGELEAAGVPGPVLRVSGEAYKIEVLEAIQARRMKPVRDHYHGAGALLVDGLEFLLVTPKAQEELLHTFDKLHGLGRQIVVAGDRLPGTMAGLNEILRSRLEMGLVTELALPDAALRERLLLARAARDGVPLPPPVAAYLAAQIENPRQLVGALVRIAAYAALLRQPVTLEFAREHAAPFLAAVEPAPGSMAVAPERVVEAVCARFGIAQRALKSPEKSTALVRARQVVTLLLKELAGLSYSEISRWVGNRAPSTLSHAFHSVQKELGASPHLRRMVTQLRQELAQRPGAAAAPARPGRRPGRISNAQSNAFHKR